MNELMSLVTMKMFDEKVNFETFYFRLQVYTNQCN